MSVVTVYSKKSSKSVSTVTGRARWLVPDLSPRDRAALAGAPVRYVFVAESPHVSEVEPEAVSERRPLCGMAGRKWWSALGDVLEGAGGEDVSLEGMLALCSRHRIAVLNAVQYPIDEGITKSFPGADPLGSVGFSKNAGPHAYKKKERAAQVDAAISDLRQRLLDPALSAAEIHCLGNDSEWFVSRALTPDERAARLRDKIPHPSAWWRKGGHFGRVAREKLALIFSDRGVPVASPQRS